VSHLDPQQDRDLADLLVRDRDFIVNALYVHAAHMGDAAQEARSAYEQGRADPAVRAAQDGSLVTHQGLRMSAQMFTEQADKARALAERITRIIDGDDSPDADL
jgi:hypothetical protein